MKKVIFSVMLVGSMSFAGAGTAWAACDLPSFSDADADNSNSVSTSEAYALGIDPEMFLWYDSDTDGVLSEEEYTNLKGNSNACG